MNEKEVQRKARVTALVVAGFTIVSLACLVVAFREHTKAKHLEELSIRCHDELLRVEKVAAQSKDAAEQQRIMAIEYAHRANQALEDCKNRK
jgi:hypothetical protein